MTGPIKPPGAPKVGGVDLPDGAEGTRSRETAEAFQASLDAAAGPQSAEATTGPNAEIASALNTGSLDAAGAVDRLVAEALNSPMASSLNEEGRQALEAHLRQSLADDPSIAALVSDLERGR